MMTNNNQVPQPQPPYGQPPEYGAPQVPAYGQPSPVPAPAQPAYGAPQQNPYAQPQAPYGAAPAPGYQPPAYGGQPQSPYGAAPAAPGYGVPQAQPNDQGSFGWAILGFFIPLVGLILFLVWKDSKPGDAKKAGMGALVSVIFSVVLWLLFIIIGVVAASSSAFAVLL